MDADRSYRLALRSGSTGAPVCDLAATDGLVAPRLAGEGFRRRGRCCFLSPVVRPPVVRPPVVQRQDPPTRALPARRLRCPPRAGQSVSTPRAVADQLPWERPFERALRNTCGDPP